MRFLAEETSATRIAPPDLAAFLFGGSPRIKKRQDSAPSTKLWLEYEVFVKLIFINGTVLL
jgi:hypothetical protein